MFSRKLQHIQHIHTLKTFACNLNLTFRLRPQEKYWTRFLDKILPWKTLPFMTTERIFDRIFQCQRVEFRRKKDAIFLNKVLWKFAGKAVLDDLNCKIFFVSQSVADRTFRYIPNSNEPNWRNYLFELES